MAASLAGDRVGRGTWTGDDKNEVEKAGGAKGETKGEEGKTGEGIGVLWRRLPIWLILKLREWRISKKLSSRLAICVKALTYLIANQLFWRACHDQS